MSIAKLPVLDSLKATPPSPDYLQACTLVRERRAEETRDNAHHRLSYITLQHRIRMLPVTGVVAHLGKNKNKKDWHDAQPLDHFLNVSDRQHVLKGSCADIT